MNRHERRKAGKFEKKAQHFVAKSYLRAWCDPACPPSHEPYVWVMDRDGPTEDKPAKRRAPKNIFSEPDMYTIKPANDPGERDLSLEDMLSQIENGFCMVRRDFIEPRKPLDENVRGILCIFAAATQWRTPGARAHIQNQWGPVLDEMLHVEAQIKKMSIEERRRAAGMSPRSSGVHGGGMTTADVARLVASPLQETLASHIRVIAPMLMKLSMTIYCTTEKPGFITCDEPCVWFDPEVYKRPPMYRQAALMYKSLEITLPISPTRLMVLSHMEDAPQYFDLGGVANEAAIVDEANRITNRHAREAIIVAKNEFRPVWAERGEKPADAWPDNDPDSDDEVA